MGRWRQTRQVRVAHETFEANLRERQQTTARAGIGRELDHVASEVVVDFTVPVHQTNEAVFGSLNRNLKGIATTVSGNWRLVRAEAAVLYPVDQNASFGPQLVGREGIVAGKTYRLSRQTPLMAELNPPDPLAAIAAIRRIPSGGTIMIRQIGTKDGTRWYRVEARHDGALIGNGWVNSDALIGQELVLQKVDSKP